MDKKYTFYDLNSMMLMGIDSYGELHFIDDVSNGLLCNLKCPFCGSLLNAKNNGAIKAHHFAHVSGADCHKGHEAVLPYFIKTILKETKTIVLPHGNIYLNGKPLNDKQKATIKECSIFKIEKDKVGIIELTTIKDRKIYIVVFIKPEEAWERRHYALSKFDSVLEIDLSIYKKSQEEVVPILRKILAGNSFCMSWIKRYDESIIASKIKELALKRDELYEGDEYDRIYCPKLKKKVSVRNSECGYCDANLKNMIQTNDIIHGGCLGYIPQPHTLELLNSSKKIDMDEVFINLRREKYAKHYGNKNYYSLGDIKRMLTADEKVKIYNSELNKTYLFDGKFEVGQPMGYEVNSDTGEVSNQRKFLPLTSPNMWQIID